MIEKIRWSNTESAASDLGIDSRVRVAIDKREKDKESKIIFQYGSKILVMRLYIASKTSSAYIVGLKSIKKESSETTTLYLQVKKVCERLAEELGEFSYSLSSPNENMKEWALSKGDEIFDWDDISYLGEKKDILVCIKNFKNSKVN